MFMSIRPLVRSRSRATDDCNTGALSVNSIIRRLDMGVIESFPQTLPLDFTENTFSLLSFVIWMVAKGEKGVRKQPNLIQRRSLCT